MTWFSREEFEKDHDGWVAVIAVVTNGKIDGYWCKSIA